MWILMIRFGLPSWYAAIFTIAFAVEPTTVLFESWLFYTYPLVAVLCFAALFLHRFLTDRRMLDGVVFSLLLAVAVLTWSVFHIIWQIMIIVGLFLAMRHNRKQVTAIAGIGLSLSGAMYLKNYLLFDTLSASGFYGGTGLAIVATGELRPDQVEVLKREKTVSPVILTLDAGKWALQDYKAYLPPVEPSGVRVLDDEVKSTGSENYNHTAWAYIAKDLQRDALAVIRRFPDAYGRYVWKNFVLYFRPAGDHHFDRGSLEEYPNGRNLSPLLKPLHRITEASNWIVLPACLLFAAWFSVMGLLAWRRAKARLDDPDRLTIAFCLFTVLFVAMVTIGIGFSDQNRYRFTVEPFFYLFFALLLWKGRQLFALTAAKNGRPIRVSRTGF
jgi:hypothetical protein